MISYHGLDGFPPGGMFSYRAVGNQPTLVRFLTGRLDFIPDPLVGLDVAVSVDKGVYWLQEAVITVKIYTFYILQMWLIDWWLDVKGWNWFWQECIIREGQEIPPWHRVQITQANWIQQKLIEGKKNGNTQVETWGEFFAFSQTDVWINLDMKIWTSYTRIYSDPQNQYINTQKKIFEK